MALKVHRYDAGILHKAEPTPQGGFRVPAFVTRTGVFTYRNQDGSIRRELRTPEEVFQADSLASLAGATVTDLHPEQADGTRIPVTAANFREYTVGHAAEDARAESGYLAATLVIQDQCMIDKINSGERKELSAGYTCTLDPTAGVWDATGEVYDAIQRGIRYNHVAIGPENWGRAGNAVALRLDEAIQVPGGQKDQKVKVKINGIEYTVGTPEWAQAQAQADAQALAQKSRADAAEATLEAAKGKITKLETDLATAQDPKTFGAAVQKRTTLVLGCKRAAMAGGVTFDEKAAMAAPEGDLVVNAIKMLDPSYSVEGKTPEALAAVFEFMLGQLVKDETAEGEPPAGSPPAGSPPAGSPPAVPKTDSRGQGRPLSVFGARAGVQAPVVHQDGKDKPRDAFNVDQAAEDMHKNNRDRGSKPLAFTRK